jgi:hypothetical protein
MSSQDESTSKSYTCSNASCRKAFAQPLKASNLQQLPLKTYDACPYCLMEITSQDLNEGNAENAAQDAERLKPKLSGSAQCKKHFGYLSQQALKGQVPDECMVCKDIIPCMLKKTME